VLPRAVGREQPEQIGKQDLWSELCSEAGKAVRTLPLASLAADPDDSEGVFGKGVPHVTRNFRR
jgi:hypothetical protein